ncbi:uncharacterized protein L201_000621 [Kwoniella dendrophila CBS 6074]|uniref:C2H2-type domain-containing protein n=1 Tax=Kwoniella dendrophila CBS 6074 TaxID=1295534 RepID=A0AAX4JMK2_9TREE
MFFDIAILLLLILIEAPLVGEESKKCECPCSCGRKDYMPSGYIHDHDYNSGVVEDKSKDEQQQIQEQDKDRKKENEELVNEDEEQKQEQEPIYVGTLEEEEEEQKEEEDVEVEEVNKGQDVDNEYDENGVYKGGWGDENETESYSATSIANSNRERLLSSSNNSKRDYSTRPKPPHFDRSVPDRKSPYITSTALTATRKKKDDYWCDHCQRPFIDLVAIQQHNFAVHSTSTSRKQSQLVRSMIPEIDSSIVMCEVCRGELPTLALLKAHKAAQRPWSIFCSDCLLTFDHAQQAQDHYQFHHNTEFNSPRRIQSMLDTLKGIPYSELSSREISFLYAHASDTSPVPFNNPQSQIPSAVFSNEDHYIRTFPSHTIQAYYECDQCNMVFGNNFELQAHKATPLVHGGRIYEADDYPPLGRTPTPAPVPASISARKKDTLPTIGVQLDESEEAQTTWGMPSFTLDATKSEDLPDQVWTPQARLTPEPESASIPSEDEEPLVLSSNQEEQVKKDDDKEGSAILILDEQPKNPEESTPKVQVVETLAEDNLQEKGLKTEQELDQIVSDLASAAPEPHPSSEVSKSTASEASNQEETQPTLETTTVSPVIAEKAVIEVQSERTVERQSEAVEIKTLPPVAKPSSPLQTLSPRPIIHPVPSKIKLTPYAKAALESASRLGEYPPPEEHNEEQGTWGENAQIKEQTDEPEIIGGIECHLPSFLLPVSSPKRGTSSSTSGALSLESTPPLTLNSDSSSSMTDSLVLGGEEEDLWAASQEVYEIAHSAKRQMFSLDLGSTSNGNRPKFEREREPRSDLYSNSKRSRNDRRRDGGRRRERETFLTPAQREAYYNGGGGKSSILQSNKSRSRANERPDKEVKQPLQPMFESEWSTLTPSNSNSISTGGRGGLLIKESPWNISRKQADERNKLVYSSSTTPNGIEEDDIYGGW